MNQVADLSKQGIAERREAAKVQAAYGRLIAKADQAWQRAGRAAKGSNERERYTAIGRHLRSCAAILNTDEDYQAELLRTGMIDRGWRALADAISAIYRRKEKQPPTGRPR